MGADSGPLSEVVTALATGHWSTWPGLPAGLTAEQVAAALGDPLDATAHGGTFGGSPTMFRRWGPTAGAPRGLTVWFEGEVAVGVQVEGAVRAEDDGELPAPDTEEESGLGVTARQYLWAARGLVLHTRGEGAAATEADLLLGLAPTTPEAWQRDPLRHWRAERRRR